MSYITLPGIGNSGPAHWHSHWEAESPSFQRFSPADWYKPDLDDWLNALEAAVTASPVSPILVAHSLACLLVAHWSKESRTPVAGAFLVAVPDPRGPRFPRQAGSFLNVPDRPLRFPAVVVASRNDPYGAFDYVTRRARDWRAGLIDIGDKGHINADSGLGDWLHGRQLLRAFEADLAR